MALFRYQGFSKEGKRVSGIVDAGTIAGAQDQVARMGFFPTGIVPVETAEEGFTWQSLFERSVSTKDKILFTKQLSVLLKSGVPLLQALDLLIEQFENPLKTIIINLRDGIKEGKSFADGLARYPKVFENIYIQLVRAGEATGKMELILDRLTVFMERSEEVSGRVRGALRTPFIQLGVVVLVVVFLVTQVVPTMTEIFTESGKELPLNTRILLAISHFFIDHYITLGAILFVSWSLFMYWKSTPSGAKTLDTIALKLPVIKFFAKTTAIVQFCRTLGMLLESGVNLSEALDIVVNIIDNRVLTDELKLARDKIVKEGKLAPCLQQTGLFPPMAIYLINTGEQSGQLDAMLITVAQNYETDLTEATDTLSSAVAPVMLFIMLGVVGFIVFSILGPMMEMGSVLTGETGENT